VTDPVEHLDLRDLLQIARRLFGDSPAIRDLGLLEAAVARPRTTLGGQDAYPDVWTKAAALLDSIVNGHALIDGNKRLGWTACAVFLETNGSPCDDAAADHVVALVEEVAGPGRPDVQELASSLRALVAPHHR